MLASFKGYRSLRVYQILPRSFNLPGWLRSYGRQYNRRRSWLRNLADNLDLIKDLGFTSVWVTTLWKLGKARQKGIGSPYAIADHTHINPKLGTWKDFGYLCDQSTEVGLDKPMVDLILNHTSFDATWGKELPYYYVRAGCQHHADCAACFPAGDRHIAAATYRIEHPD